MIPRPRTERIFQRAQPTEKPALFSSRRCADKPCGVTGRLCSADEDWPRFCGSIRECAQLKTFYDISPCLTVLRERRIRERLDADSAEIDRVSRQAGDEEGQQQGAERAALMSSRSTTPTSAEPGPFQPARGRRTRSRGPRPWPRFQTVIRAAHERVNPSFPGDVTRPDRYLAGRRQVLQGQTLIRLTDIPGQLELQEAAADRQEAGFRSGPWRDCRPGRAIPRNAAAGRAEGCRRTLRARRHPR